MPSRPGLDELVERLGASLEQVGDALIRLDTDTLLASEVDIARLMDELASVKEASPDERDAVVAQARRARAALLRCRRLGASFAAVARVRLPMCTGGQTYGRAGQFAPPPARDSQVKARV